VVPGTHATPIRIPTPESATDKTGDVAVGE
jgi:hypothetical protein